MNDQQKEAWLVYDKKCPVCNNYVTFFRARKTINLHLVDAREDSAIMKEITKKDLDIDEGMVLKIDDILFYGSDAMHALALLGTKSGWLNKLNYYLFSSKIIAHIVYPIGKAIRNLVLKLLNIPKIYNLKNKKNGN